MKKKITSQREMMKCFINATYSILESEGIKNIPIREIANKAGYNSATIYNYFENLEHLMFFTYLKHFNIFIRDLSESIDSKATPKDMYLNMLECFLIHSYSNPKVFYYIFFNKYSNSLEHDIKEYYLIFEEELEENIIPFITSVKGGTIYEIHTNIVTQVFENINESDENLIFLSELIVLVYHGLLHNLVNNPKEDISLIVKKTLDYIKKIIYAFENNFLLKECI